MLLFVQLRIAVVIGHQRSKTAKIIEGGEGREKIWKDLEVALTEFSL
jgi:hypothetical protein